MKKLFTLLFSFIVLSVAAQQQQPLRPGDPSLQTKWIKNESYQMKWYIMRDSVSRYEVARINTKIQVGKDKLVILSDVDVNNAKTTWIDTTTTALPGLEPIRHYSDNLERAVSLKFGTTVSGGYTDKLKNRSTVITQGAEGSYFDSNFYSYLLRLLPLEEGYTRDIITYDYSPAKKGLFKAQVTGVKSGKYRSKKAVNQVWIVSSTETVKGQTTQVKYYIDKKDRKIWKQEIFDGFQHTLIERLEP